MRDVVLWVAAVDLVAGAVFAAWFVAFGVARVDAAAARAAWWVKVVWVPGVVALWPLLAWKVARGARGAGGAGGAS